MLNAGFPAKLRRRSSGFSLIEVSAVSVIIGLVSFTMLGFVIYLVAMKHEKLNTGCRKFRSWIARIQSECVLNSRECIIQYDLSEDKFKAGFISGDTEDDMFEQDDLTVFDLPAGVKIVSVSLDPYRTYFNDIVSVSARKDGWVTPHLICLGIQDDETDMKICTLEVMALTGQVNVYDGEKGWEDLE